LATIAKNDDVIGSLKIQPSRLQFQFSAETDFNHEKKLHLVRRLDWRFLLPNPNLARVVYLGQPDSELTTALQHFANYFEILHSDTPSRRPFDLAVVHSPRIADAIAAFDLIGDGGFLYWEIVHKSHFASAKLGANMRVLMKAGFKNIEAHWHRPNFAKALDIVPVFDETALAYFFSPDRGDRKKSAAGRFLKYTGLLKFAMKSVSVVATKIENVK
jgi:hypothetical protein